MAPKKKAPKGPTPKEMDENRLVEEARMTAEAAAADQEWMAGLSAWLEETLVDEAMGDDALDVALCAEIAARLARRQAAERLRLEDLMRAEAKKADDKLKEMEKELRKAELARQEARRLARDAKEFAALEPVLYDPGSIALCRILTKHWGALSPLFSSLGGTMPVEVPESPRVDQLVTPGGRHAKPSSEGRPSSALRVSGTSRRSLEEQRERGGRGLSAVEIMCGLQIVLKLPPAPPPASVMRFAQLIGGSTATVPLDLMDTLLRPGGWSDRAEAARDPPRGELFGDRLAISSAELTRCGAFEALITASNLSEHQPLPIGITSVFVDTKHGAPRQMLCLSPATAQSCGQNKGDVYAQYDALTHQLRLRPAPPQEITQPPPAAATSSPAHVGSGGSYPADGSAPSAGAARPLSNTPMAGAAAASHEDGFEREDGYERGVTPAPPGPPEPLPEISFGRPLPPERFEYLKPSSPRPNGQQVNLLRRPLSPASRPSRPKSASPGASQGVSSRRPTTAPPSSRSALFGWVVAPAGLGLGALPALSPGVHPGRPNAPHPRSPLPRKYGAGAPYPRPGTTTPSPGHAAAATVGGGGSPGRGPQARPQSAAPAIPSVFHSFNGGTLGGWGPGWSPPAKRNVPRRPGSALNPVRFASGQGVA